MNVVARDVLPLKGPAAAQQPPAPTPLAGRARFRRRHLAALVSFVLLVLLPLDLTGYYLFFVARDQYASRVGFSVRKEEPGSAVELLGGVAELSASSSSDTDILARFIRSQELVERVDRRLGLARLYAASGDPVFGLRDDPAVEDLLRYWRRMVRVYYEPSTGLIELRVLAFSAADATAIAAAVFDESSAMINRLSSIAREDATKYARDDLERSVDRLRAARQALAGFRTRTRIVDPSADIEERMGLLARLQARLTDARIELDILRDTTRASDPRIEQATRRAAVIEAQISEVRSRFGLADGENSAYSALMAEYEGLSVDLQFAEEAYLSALAAHEAARAEARRQSRYLAAYLGPTQAGRADYPRRFTLLALAAGFLLLFWSILMLIFYSIRDRR